MNDELKYDNATCNQFVSDMQRAGFEVEHYRGRYFWQGPSVCTSRDNGPSYEDIVRATRVDLQRDNLCFDWIVYPIASGKLIDD